MTFNTTRNLKNGLKMKLMVLNLVINGWPSILIDGWKFGFITVNKVLNLVINGWPSILETPEI